MHDSVFFCVYMIVSGKYRITGGPLISADREYGKENESMSIFDLLKAAFGGMDHFGENDFVKVVDIFEKILG